MLISKKAAEILFRMFLSCAPLKECMLGMSGKPVPVKELFDKIKKAATSVDFSIFKRALEPLTFKKIQETALASGKKGIDVDLIVQIFGGSAHFEKILGQLRAEKKIPEDYFKKTLFAHMAVVVEILGKKDNLACGVYRNGDLEVRIENLVIFPGDSVNIGNKVLVHYALIVATGISREARIKTLIAQGRCREFSEACLYLKRRGGINYDGEFMDLCGITSAVVKKYE